MRQKAPGRSQEAFKLLSEVLQARNPILLQRYEERGLDGLSAEDREAIQSVLADELIESGLREDDEPTERGRRLDDLIGLLSPVSIRTS